MLIEEFYLKLQSYILAISNRGAVISGGIANLAVTALTKNYPNVKGKSIKNLQARACFSMLLSPPKHTSAKVYIPEAARKKNEFFFLYEIATKVEKHSIPIFFMNFDQTPLKLVPCVKNTLAKKNSNLVPGASDKLSITSTFAITVTGNFLPSATNLWKKKTLLRYSFLEIFALSVNQEHFSNRKEAAKFHKSDNCRNSCYFRRLK